MSWTTFNWVDWLILAILAISIIVSLVRGFVREILSLTVWILATVVAYLLGDELGVLMKGWIHNESLRVDAGTFLLFIATLLIGSFFNYLLTESVRNSSLTFADRILGIFFGLLRGVVIVMMLVLFAPAGLLQSKSWQASELGPRFVAVENGWRHAVQELGSFVNRFTTG